MAMFSKNTPYEVPVRAGESVWLCQCGMTRTAPYCDGSHAMQEADIEPLHFAADKSGTVWICGCGRSQDAPFCDGSHKGGCRA